MPVCLNLRRHAPSPFSTATSRSPVCAILVLGFLLAIPAVISGYPGPVERGPEVGNMEAMQYARQPIWVMFANPILGAVGVMVGARMRKGA